MQAISRHRRGPTSHPTCPTCPNTRIARHTALGWLPIAAKPASIARADHLDGVVWDGTFGGSEWLHGNLREPCVPLDGDVQDASGSWCSWPSVPVGRDLQGHGHAAFGSVRALDIPARPIKHVPVVWYEFLAGYGVSNAVMFKVASDYPELFTHDIYTAGQSILFFKSFGWHDKHIIDRIVAQWPQLLAKSVTKDMMPVVEHLEGAGCRGRNLQLLVWEYPRIFNRDYRRHASRFARLGVYGLQYELLCGMGGHRP